jgi:hypothetical protein
MKASAAGLLIILMTLLTDGNIMEELLISYQRLSDISTHDLPYQSNPLQIKQGSVHTPKISYYSQ